jgi:hypothetical protein
VPETGTGSAGDYYDRGAVQIQDTFAATYATDPDDNDGTTALSVLAGFNFASNSWSDKVTEVVNWGDGTTSTVVNSVQTGAADGLTLPTHKYAKPGTYKVSGAITDGTVTVSGSYPVTTNGSDFTAYGPTRILDTRDGTGAPEAKLTPGATVSVKIEGNGSIPATGVTAVAVNLTATDTSGSGFVTADNAGNVSNLNYTAGKTVANTAIIPVNSNGTIDLYNGGAEAGPIDLIADVSGYYSTSSTGAYIPITPTRVTDTRTLPGFAVTKGMSLGTFPYDAFSAPAGLSAYVLNITATDTNGSGYITAYQSALPNASNLNYTLGTTVANLAQVSATVLSPNGGDVNLYNGGASAGNVQLIEDVFGYYSTN